MDGLSDEQMKVNWEAKLNDVLNVFCTSTLLDEAFRGFLVDKFDGDKNPESRLNNLIQFWKSCPQKCHEHCVKCYVEKMHTEDSLHLKQTMTDVLKQIVDNNIVPAKIVCEQIMSSELMTFNRPLVWSTSLKLLKHIIGRVDYKGCRDLLHHLLEKTCKIPSVTNISTLKLLDATFEVISYLMDRKVCLLPAYFVVNEIVKLFAEDKRCPHWKIAQLMSDYVQSFLPIARMVTISGRSKLLPIVGHSNSNCSTWRLFSNSLKFNLNGPLPYDDETRESQTNLLRYVMEQPYSREMVCSMLGLNKQAKIRCSSLEEQFIELVIKAMENHVEGDDDDDDDDDFVSGDGNDNGGKSSSSVNNDNNGNSSNYAKNSEDEREHGKCQKNVFKESKYLWDHLSCQLIFFVLFQFTNFSHIVTTICKELRERNLRKSRDNLMWMLLQFISGSIQKNALDEFLPVIKLYEFLYPETQPLPLPCLTKKSCTRKMAATCTWVHLVKKAQADRLAFRMPLPIALAGHIEFLQQLTRDQSLSLNNYKIVLLSNAYSTNSEYFGQPMSNLIEGIYGVPQNSILLPGDVPAYAPTLPLSVKMLDSLTVHAKMSLIHSIVTRLMKLAQNRQNTMALSPSLVETYSRLLVYTEIESLGIKGFIGQVLMSVFKDRCWSILHTLLELCNYRLHHIQPHYRVQLLCQLQSILQLPHAGSYQLHLCIENTALHLITGLSNWEMQPQFSRILAEPKYPNFFSSESEELNKALVLAMARSMHITGSESLTWCRDVLVAINQATPLSWSTFTVNHFPPTLANFYLENPSVPEDKQSIKRNVETEYRKWKSMASENDLIAHFSSSSSQPLFICVLWKCLLEDNRITPNAYKVLDRLGPKALSSHLRHFVDYVIIEMSNPGATSMVNKYVDSISDLVWKWNITTLDRLVLYMVLRSFEPNDTQVCFYIIQVLLLKPNEFKNRVSDFVSENLPDHWLLTDWHEKHMAFHKKYPEKFYFDSIPEVTQQPVHVKYMPVHFSNVCLRFIPVLDLLVHRFIEVPQVYKSLDQILKSFGGLYKFHSRPLTYLYNTLHYYERHLTDKQSMKRKLLQAVAGALKGVRPKNWILSDEYLEYLQQTTTNESYVWLPDSAYYFKLVSQLVETIKGNGPYVNVDWRFSEFTNPASQCLTRIAVELLSLPLSGQQVGACIYNVVLKNSLKIPRHEIMSWMNAIGLITTCLPESYWAVLNDLIFDMMNKELVNYNNNNINNNNINNINNNNNNNINNIINKYRDDRLLQSFNFCSIQKVAGETQSSYLLALSHAVYQHASITQLNKMIIFMKEKLKPMMSTEAQFLFTCHMIGPFLQRFHTERTRSVLELTVELYESLERVDKCVECMHHMDEISDFLYHIKYMFVGDGVKSEVERIIKGLRPELQMRLRFISFHSKEEQQQQQQ